MTITETVRDGSDDQAPYAIEFHKVRKVFPGVVALDGVTFSVRTGQVHALVGENGAGKSTLIKVLAGTYRPESGTMVLDGNPFAPESPHDALAAGIRSVNQELSIMPELSVAENICVERLPRKGFVVDRRAMQSEAAELLTSVGLDIKPSARAGDLGVAQRQLLEIAKALRGNPTMLLLDEPTASLTPSEVERLFSLVRALRTRGVSILYISHHLEEIFEICDRVTVMRNGKHISTNDILDTTPDELVRDMVGRDLAEQYPCDPSSRTETVALAVRDLRVRGYAQPASFDAHSGEVLGIAGLAGSGRSELLRAVFGADASNGGTISVGGRTLRSHTPKASIAQGLCMLTEDRKGEGIVPTMSVAVNITIGDLEAVTRSGTIDRAAEHRVAASLIEQHAIKVPSPESDISNLSGGNQQKVLIARWLMRQSDVLLLDEPTRGIDVGAKREIHVLLRDLARAGKSVVVVSSDMPELMGICHRIVVVSRGRIVGELERKDFDSEALLSLSYSAYTASANATPKNSSPTIDPEGN